MKLNCAYCKKDFEREELSFCKASHKSNYYKNKGPRGEVGGTKEVNEPVESKQTLAEVKPSRYTEQMLRDYPELRNKSVD